MTRMEDIRSAWVSALAHRIRQQDPDIDLNTAVGLAIEWHQQHVVHILTEKEMALPSGGPCGLYSSGYIDDDGVTHRFMQWSWDRGLEHRMDRPLGDGSVEVSVTRPWFREDERVQTSVIAHQAAAAGRRPDDAS